MKTAYTLPLDDNNATLDLVGGKGASLARMAGAGLPVPGGYHITTEAYRRFVAENHLQPRIAELLEPTDCSKPETLEIASRKIFHMFINAPVPAEIAKAVVQAYAALPGRSPAVAVRSSATAEDLPEASFAGQQETFLNISGAEAVLNAVQKCWASLWTARAIAYRARQNIAMEDVALAVVVQLLVPAEAAGIMFTANPVNGNRGQIIINASWGLGEAVVSGRVTPDTLTVEKSSGKVIMRETAEKLIQTVRMNGWTEDQPVSQNLRRAQVLNDHQASDLAALGERIERLYGIPMDIEWAMADGQFAIVQARPITALPDPEPAVPSEWKLPKGAYAAMRNNIVELMADPLTPLFRTLGLQAVNNSMDRMMTGFLGSPDILPSDPIITVNQYAYYNGSVKFLPMLKIILNTWGILKRMFTGAVERWTETGRPYYMQTIETWRSRNWKGLSYTDLLDAARQLSEAAIDAYGALVSGVIPAAWISEAIFTWTYKIFRRRGDPPAPHFLLGFDSQPIRAEKSLYDLAEWAREHPGLGSYLSATSADQIPIVTENNQPPEGVGEDLWAAWRTRFHAHLREYGHMIYNLDFANPVPMDDPIPMLETLKLFLSGQGTNPYSRQKASAERREQATHRLEQRLPGLLLKIFRTTLHRAQKYAPLREDGLADVGLSYPLLRQMLLELGRRLVATGMIDRPEDIFWLEQDEVEGAAGKSDLGESMSSAASIISKRKANWRAARKISPPVMLPQMKIFGIDLIGLKFGARKRNGTTLKGVAASPGQVTAPACVVHGPEDFAQMNVGDVLVAPLTTPAWTPLFARAAAIVTDVGGPLSHGSIVAREYGIPAVLGTGSATTHIRNGQMVTVDGSSGSVLLGGNEV